MFVLIIIVFAFIAWLEMVPLYRRRMMKELSLYAVLYTIALVLSLLMSFGVEIPSVARMIENIVNLFLGK